METMVFVAFMVKFGLFAAGSALVSTLVTVTVYDLVRNKVSEGGVFGSASLQEPAKGGAS
jgi:hypothetical protein